MIPNPFWQTLDNTFANDRRLWPKLIGALVVGVIVSINVYFRCPEVRREMIYVAPVLIAVCLVVVLALSVKDAVKRELQDGHPVHGLLRLYLASGFVSFLAWIATAIFPLAVAAIVFDMVGG